MIFMPSSASVGKFGMTATSKSRRTKPPIWIFDALATQPWAGPFAVLKVRVAHEPMPDLVKDNSTSRLRRSGRAWLCSIVSIRDTSQCLLSHEFPVSKLVLPYPESATIVPLMRTELVTTLKRQATELLADIERDKQPILITQHGLPSAYLVDVETFELLQQRMAVLEGIARGEMAVAEGRAVTHAEARSRMARWLK